MKLINTSLNKTCITIACLCMTLATGITHAAEDAAMRGQPLDRIVAVVNDSVILESDLERKTDEIRAVLRQQGQELPPAEILRSQVLERLVGIEVQKQFADRAGIAISDDRVNQALQQIAERNEVSLSELPQQLAQQGLSYRQFRESIREELLLTEVRRRVVDGKVSVSPREVEDFLKQRKRENADTEYQLSQILIAVPGQASPEEIEVARERIIELREQVVSGDAKFHDIALQHSDGQRALEGGSLGWRRAGQVPTLFVEPVTRLGVGEVSQPIRSGSGWHIVRVDDMKSEDLEPVVATETKVRHILIQPNKVVTPEDAGLQLLRLRQQIREGADFAELAREHSDDTSAAQGGDLGWNPPGRFVPRFQEVVDDLPIGSLSEPFETQFGWHIVEVLDRRETDFTEMVAENRAYQVIRERKAEEAFPRWIQQQMEEAYIERRLDN
jgi:peptidyl-prolyl cis-trans isomerase SurA